MLKQPRGNALLGIVVLVAIGWGISSLFSGGEDDNQDYSASTYSGYSSYRGYDSSNYEDSYDYEEEEYPAGFSGTDTMEACNQNSGNCYDLDIDSDGENIERINFPNGGWRDVDSSDCDEGYCYVTDEDGTDWELQY